MGDNEGEAPIQVFIMMGQSNMLGFGTVQGEDKPGTLESLTAAGKYPELRSPDGNKEWFTSSNVKYVQTMYKRGKMEVLTKPNSMLTVPPKGARFGPELGFGLVLGNYFQNKGNHQKALLLKCCIGNRSLGWDLLPPGSPRIEQDGMIYAGYKESPGTWKVGTEPEPIKWYAGKQYDDDVGMAKEILSKIEEYGGTSSYEIAGFVWWQGHKDSGNIIHVNHYEENLVRLIQQLRVDFDSPKAKFVLATLGHDGVNQQGKFLTISNAQLAVDGDNGKYPEFAGNVKTVDARPHWRGKEDSPKDQHHHYNQNAETFVEVGKALGEAMVDLLQKEE